MGAISHTKNMHKLIIKWKSNWHLMFNAVATIHRNRIFQVFNFMTISCSCIALNFKIGYTAAEWADDEIWNDNKIKKNGKNILRMGDSWVFVIHEIRSKHGE